MVDAEHRDAGVFERFELGLDGGVSQDGDDRVDLAGQEHVVVVGMDLVVAAAVSGDRGAAQALHLGNSALERLTIPEMLRADHRNTNRQTLQRQLSHGGGFVGWFGIGRGLIGWLGCGTFSRLLGLIAAGCGFVVIVAA